MKKITLLLAILLLQCNTFNINKNENFHFDELDRAANDLKNQLIKNYKVEGKKTLAIASFARTDLVKPFSKYSSSVPKLGIFLANSLQNEMFNQKFLI